MVWSNPETPCRMVQLFRLWIGHAFAISVAEAATKAQQLDPLLGRHGIQLCHDL